ncbi:hypothetical protein V1504DRAFT_462369, partial [Lipomyces starkeyi]
ILQRLQPKREPQSDIDRYFKGEIIDFTGAVSNEKSWLCAWWKAHRDEFPRMALAARDY